MRLKVLCVGDVVGSPGRRVVGEKLSALAAERDIACSIVNAENVASGSGITPALFQKLMQSGVNVVTLGDHIYRRRDIIPLLETSDRIVKPANLPIDAPGKDLVVFETNGGVRVAVFSLMGRLYMKPMTDCPFKAADRVLSKVPRDVRVVVCDLHAEATSEKVAMGWYLDGRVSVLFGTHTHVPTADERILPGGTGYITDVGMTGPYDSVLGRDKDRVTSSMVTGVPSRFDVAEADVRMCGIVAEINADSGRCTAIERVCIRDGQM